MIKSIMRALSAQKQASQRSQGENVYDHAESGPVWLSMWEDKRRNELRFTANRVISENGRNRFYRSIEPAMFSHFIAALGDLAGKYAEEGRFTQSRREEFRAYRDALRTLPGCVRKENASTESSTENGAAS